MNKKLEVNDQPLISIVMSTYNRGNLLPFVVQTVQWQTWKNWELLIIGDACTDDTEKHILSFNEPRIHFHNLPQNCGEQSGPNNEGTRMANGEIIAYLNHDDLWWPDHLEKGFQTLKDKKADLIFSWTSRIFANGRVALNGYFPDGNYCPKNKNLIPASSWILRKSTFDSIGGWRNYLEIYNIPSQDFLFRAWRSGKKMCMSPHLSVIALGSRTRINCYKNRDYHEHEKFIHDMKKGEAYRNTLYETHILKALEKRKENNLTRLWNVISFNGLANSFFLLIGKDPVAINKMLKNKLIKGEEIRKLRRKRGLDE